MARPVPDLVTSSVAIFELPPTATDVHSLEPPIPDLGREADDRPDARQIGRLTIEAALTSGAFLADVRPEQVVAMPDGRVLLTGCDAIGRLDLATRRALLDLLPALVARDPAGQMAALQDLGIAPPGARGGPPGRGAGRHPADQPSRSADGRRRRTARSDAADFGRVAPPRGDAPTRAGATRSSRAEPANRARPNRRPRRAACGIRPPPWHLAGAAGPAPLTQPS